MHPKIYLCAFVIFFLSPKLVFSQHSRNSDAEEDFVRRIAPLLQEKCLGCHGRDEADLQGGLDVRSLSTLLKGGDSELPAIVAGKPELSPLYLAATRTHETWSPMPPKEADGLSATQLASIRNWIAGGAPWPDKSRFDSILIANQEKWSAEDGTFVKTSGGLSADWTNRRYMPEGLWAYRAVGKPEIKEVGSAAIDALIEKQMPVGVTPGLAAAARTFIRRASFDLTGLPPSPEETAAFEEAYRLDPDAAVAALVDRLLASPHYGERMAQHWLDVVRYADSSGFANDFARGNAWRYRDYVIRAFNSDKPYDEFVREQIAGDEIDPTDPEKIVATGFLRMGPWELTGMEVAKIARQRFLDDVTNSVGETFLSHSLQCARCHDHKFDPIPTQDYYAIQAVFATTQLAERDATFLPTENTSGFEERNYLIQTRQEHHQTLQRLEEKSLQAANEWFREQNRSPEKWVAALELAKKRSATNLFSAARNALLSQGVSEDQFPPRMIGWTPEEIGLERIARKGLERIVWELDRYQPYALAVYSGRTPAMNSVTSPLRVPGNFLTEGELEETCILTGGDPFSSGKRVQPGVMSVLSSVQAEMIPEGIVGRRKVFADWVASSENPLTARSIVNRVWMWHFGQPLAGNPNNFGSTGKRPSHPELLDWLAATMIEQNWSFKSLHKIIMTSATYRRSAHYSDRKALAELDPEGTSYAVFTPRRLSGEELRDAMLVATGELNRTLGGIPNRPEINAEAALQPRQVMGTFAEAWTPNPLPAQRNRRSIYALRLRGLSDPMLEVFNVPSSDFSCERRESSTVTPQVFALFNSKVSYQRALALASRVTKETETGEQAIARCFELTLGRSPQDAEVSDCLEHWQQMKRIQSGMKVTSSVPPLEVRRDAIEENTGGRFTFTERLVSNADYVSDLLPDDVDVRTRALADFCLVLFNTNEFSYVY